MNTQSQETTPGFTPEQFAAGENAFMALVAPNGKVPHPSYVLVIATALSQAVGANPADLLALLDDAYVRGAQTALLSLKEVRAAVNAAG